MRKAVIHVAVWCLLHALGLAASSGQAPGAVPTWTNVLGATDAWTVDDEQIATTGRPRCVLRTDRQYENYVLAFDFMTSDAPGGVGLVVHADALPAPGLPWPLGIDIRLDAPPGHAVITPLGGAHVEPVVRPGRSGTGASDARGWRHARIESRDGHLSVTVDGVTVATANYASPRKGYVALKSDGAAVRFRSVRIDEWPSTDPAPYEVAEPDRGFVSLYDGRDLSSHWEMKPGHRGHWTAHGWVIDYDGASEERDKNLWSRKEYGNFELIADVRLTREPEPAPSPVVLPSGETARDAQGELITVEVPYAGDTGIYVRGSSKNQINIGNRYLGSGDVYGYRVDEQMPAEVRRAVTPRVKANHPPGRWDRYVVTMRGDRLTVELNGHLIIDDARLPGVAPRGRLALQDDHATGNTFQFANLYIREIE